jgi:hypothetical protein
LRSSTGTPHGSASVEGIIKEAVEALAKTVSLAHVGVIYVQSEESWTITAKIILSYHRRLTDLFQFYAEGRAK